MNTRSTSKRLVSPLSNPESLFHHTHRVLFPNTEEMNPNEQHLGPPPMGGAQNNVIPPMGPQPAFDPCPMEEQLQSPFNGVRRAIVIPEINANFEINHGLLNLITSISFHGFEHEDQYAHIRNSPTSLRPLE